MGLQTGRFVKIAVQCAIVLLAIEFNEVRWIKFCVSLALHKNGLLIAPKEEVYSSRVNRRHWDSGCLKVCIGYFKEAIFRNRYFVIRLSEIDPFVRILGKGILCHCKCQTKEPYPNLSLHGHFHPNQSCQQGKYGLKH